MADIRIRYDGRSIAFQDRLLFEGKRRVSRDVPASIKYSDRDD
jgi:hypothetical protein